MLHLTSCSVGKISEKRYSGYTSSDNCSVDNSLCSSDTPTTSVRLMTKPHRNADREKGDQSARLTLLDVEMRSSLSARFGISFSCDKFAMIKTSMENNRRSFVVQFEQFDHEESQCCKRKSSK
ncbi:hypothetical protein HN011_003732 [Eciton burchellii]|nr:hypothetical protein HN011_003732 [Eciton burchellii]